MIQTWKRKEAEFAFIWNMTDFRRESKERKDYQFEKIVDGTTAEAIKKPFTKSSMRSFVVTTPLVVFGLSMIGIAFVGFRIWSTLVTSMSSVIFIGCLNGISICILNYAYTWLAVLLTNFENHQFEDQWEDSFIFKTYCFQFVNSYISLFAVAFYDVDLSRVASSMGSNFFMQQFVSNILEMTWPSYYDTWKINKLREHLALRRGPPIETSVVSPSPGPETMRQLEQLPPEHNVDLELNYLKSYTNDLILEYCELVIQLGYIAMFSCALPISPLFALLNNLWEVKGEINLCLNINRRPIAEGVKSIGAWMWVLDVFF